MNEYKTFKVQRPRDFNVTENKKFINVAFQFHTAIKLEETTIHPVWV